MRVCFVAEGCYPYVVGGVSSWIHNMIRSFPTVDFSILAIIPGREMSGKFIYELPENVREIREVCLNDLDWGKKKKGFRLPKAGRDAIRSLVMDQDPDWDGVFDCFKGRDLSLNDLLMGEDFFKTVRELYDREYPEITFTDFLWTMRSVYLPLFQVLNADVPEADIYHCVATGYSGVLGCMARHFHGGEVLLTEHGIYTREREEELIKAEWVEGFYKSIWIEHFKKMSRLAYERAAFVTSLFEHASELQAALGCPAEKQLIIPNGIRADIFAGAPGKTEEEKKAGFIEVGAFVRLAPIKDIKTLIQAFHEAKQQVPALRLWIMGPDEDKTYAAECRDYVEQLRLKDVFFTGMIKTAEYIGKMDFTILTSISEGQPLTILEGYAAGKPAIATDVGNCRGLLYGENGDTLGEAGILTHIMRPGEIAAAMVELARHPQRTERMGRIGYERLISKYTIRHMHEAYGRLYSRLAERTGITWQESE